KPSAAPRAFAQIVAITDFSELSKAGLQRAYWLAERTGAEAIRVVRVFTVFTQAKEQPTEFFGKEGSHRPMLEAEEKHIAEFAAAAGTSPVPVEAVCVEGTTGFAASDYVEGVNADLLVVPSHPPGTPQLLPDGMDWVFSVIPTNLFIVR
ncbi:MAG TPA: universal stress protein, partial [Chthoniobacteraceae bacterium]|nr:universal stress protein [Chthoniobacteraceae bacterium]